MSTPSINSWLRHCRGKMTDLAEQRTEGKWKRMEIGLDGIVLSVDAVLTCESRMILIINILTVKTAEFV